MVRLYTKQQWQANGTLTLCTCCGVVFVWWVFLILHCFVGWKGGFMDDI